MAIRLTEQRLRQIIREEAQGLMEGVAPTAHVRSILRLRHSEFLDLSDAEFRRVLEDAAAGDVDTLAGPLLMNFQRSRLFNPGRLDYREALSDPGVVDLISGAARAALSGQDFA